MASGARVIAGLLACGVAAAWGTARCERERRELLAVPRVRQHAHSAAALAELRGGRLGDGADTAYDSDDDDDDDDELAIEDAMRLKARGNALVKVADYAGAAAKYREAVRELDFDGRGGRRTAELDRRVRLNLASCLLRLGDLDKAAEQCTVVGRIVYDMR